MTVTTDNFKIAFILLIGLSITVYSQDYTSLSDGSWTTTSNWSNTSGWGTSTPPTDGSHGSGTITMQHNMSISGNYSTGSATLNVGSGKTLTVSGNMTLGGGSTVNVYGTLTITGDLTLNSSFIVHPGGSVIVDGTVTIVSAPYLTIGTGASGPPYADMVIKQDLVSQSSGDATVEQNGRLAVFGNVFDDGSGGTFLQINNGGQVYIDGNVTYSGGGSSINNNNSSDPYGLYVNGTVTNSGGGSTTTGNMGDRTDLENTNPDFFNWVASQPESPLPVTLLYFKVSAVTPSGITLYWATGSELHVDYFRIEKSMDGFSFREMARVKTLGDTEETRQYSVTDEKPVLGNLYYRLSEVTMDGQTNALAVVRANFEGSKNAVVHPNPLTQGDRVSVSLNFMPSQPHLAIVLDLTGKVVGQALVGEGEAELPFDLSPGTYIVRIGSADFNSVSKLIVR